MQKTNAIRMLEKAKIKFYIHEYDVPSHHVSGAFTAQQMGISPEQLFKTLVLESDKKEHFVACIPSDQELDFKKTAKAFGVKKIEMLQLKKLTSLTGYIQGGCSPIGMKKDFPTVFDETVQLFDTIFISAGMRGLMIEISCDDLLIFIDAKISDIIK